jgi:RNA polymerase sigma factor (sigma-70 family)
VDATLVAASLAGDQSAWAQLLTRHRPLVLAVARRCGMAGDDLEDVYQSVCLTLLERLDLLRDHRSLAAWVATTTARRCWRLRAARPETALPEGRDPAPGPEEVFAVEAQRSAVQEALAAMPEPCATLLRLIFVEDRSYREVARRLGLAVGSIGVYRQRCLERLRVQLHATRGRGGEGDDERG